MLVGAFNQEKALVGAFSVIVKIDGSFAALEIYLNKSAFQPELVDNPDDSKHNQEAGGSNRTTDGIVLNIMIKRASTV